MGPTIDVGRFYFYNIVCGGGSFWVTSTVLQGEASFDAKI